MSEEVTLSSSSLHDSFVINNVVMKQVVQFSTDFIFHDMQSFFLNDILKCSFLWVELLTLSTIFNYTLSTRLIGRMDITN
jgi:hypothetical protein